MFPDHDDDSIVADDDAIIGITDLVFTVVSNRMHGSSTAISNHNDTSVSHVHPSICSPLFMLHLSHDNLLCILRCTHTTLSLLIY